MHELSLCGAIADTVNEHAEGRTVERVELRIGHFRQVVPETLQRCWVAVAAERGLSGAELVIDHVPAVASCRSCGARTRLDVAILRCGTCGSTAVELESGDEFLVASIDVAPAPAATVSD